MHAPTLQQPSAWVRRWAPLIRPRGAVLDVACGSGRHLRWLASQGFAVTGVDRDEAAVAPLRSVGRIVVADIERGPWPFAGERFDAVIVTNYFWRPLVKTLVDSAEVLICETFAAGNERLGKPSNPDFLLHAGELLWACAEMHIAAYEDGVLEAPPRRVQRIAARRRGSDPAPLEFAP